MLFDLAQHPQYIPELREEIESVIQSEGLTKASMLNLFKVDSFIKESQRIGGILSCTLCFPCVRKYYYSYLYRLPVTLQRKAQKDFTFSDGLVIPKGSYVTVASKSMHQDEASVYPSSSRI